MRIPKLKFLSPCVLVLAACGATEEDGPLRVFVNDGVPSAPGLTLEGSAGSAGVWSRLGAASAEVYFESTDGAVRARTFLDASSGELQRILDEKARTRIEIVGDVAGSPNEIYYLLFDVDTGAYRDGYVMFLAGERIQVGRILGRSAVSGQLTGQLADAFSGATGSFALLPEGSSLVPGQVVLETGLVIESAVDVSEPVLALASGMGDVRQVEFAGSGVVRGSLRTTGILPRTLKLGGALMIAVGVVGGPPVMAVAGAATIMAGLFSNDVADAIESKFQTDETSPTGQEALNFIVDVLRDPDSRGLIGNLQRAVDGTQALLDGAKTTVSSVLDSVEAIPTFEGSSFADILPTDVFSPTYREPEDALDENTRGEIPAMEGGVQVSGQAVFQDGTVYGLEGTIDAEGTVSASGTPSANPSAASLDVTATIDAGNRVTGTFGTMDGQRQGTVDGRLEEVGACEASQGSGGEGTFTFAHVVGAGPGMVSFFHDAYSIPDQFTVTSGGAVLYTTGGLQSGSNRVELDIEAGQSAVFVSVSAPQSGTAWEYSVGCI